IASPRRVWLPASPRALGRQVNTVPAPMRCSPSMRMSLTVKLPGLAAGAWGGTASGACGPAACWAQDGAMTVARASASMWRAGVRVIDRSGLGKISAADAAAVGRRASAHQLEDVVVERKAHQTGQQHQADILPGGHRTFA